MEQLLVTFSMPQSLGIVGGRPDASLYFVGAQGESLLYLDPHQVQKAATSDADWWTFRCEVLRTLPISAIDPSLALGFYCQGEADFDDLCSRLSELESLHRNCPLICVRKCAEILQNDDIEKALQCWEDDDDVDNDSDDEEEYFTDEKSEGGVLDNSNMTCSENTDTDEEGSNDGIVIDDEIPENGGDIFEESDDEQGDGQNKYNDKYQDIPPTGSLYALEYKPHSNGESNDKTDENQIDKDSENLLRQASSVRSAWELI